ncbi:hypothetical protein ACWEVD_09915 [Nocardia thailandica]|uniref:hypothetical protein n=1 Tax=Nocardia thailandica TaxID=257275 RepID=UPI0005B7F625|nr:hypothetical protein [Nocardia thailandica]
MHPIGSRRRGLPAPPHAVFDALVRPDRDPARPWLDLLPDERMPRILEAGAVDFVVWSSLWPARPDAVVRFDIDPGAGGGTFLRWTVLVDDPVPDDATLDHWRLRIAVLVDANLRAAFDR